MVVDPVEDLVGDGGGVVDGGRGVLAGGRVVSFDLVAAQATPAGVDRDAQSMASSSG